VILERSRILSGIQFARHCIEFVFVEMNQSVGSNLNVILTLQTCGQRSSRVAGSKRRTLVCYFPARIWYMFSISKCRGELASEKNAPAQCRLPTKFAAKHAISSEVSTSQPHSFCKYRRSAQT
jgi:hypothetical protein